MKGSPISFLNDVVYKPVKDALDKEMRTSTAANLAHKVQADTIPISMEEMMWEEGVLGDKDPKTLLNTVMYLLGANFALRASDHKALRINEQLEVRLFSFLNFFSYFFSPSRFH